jgi:hypothetical protein
MTSKISTERVTRSPLYDSSNSSTSPTNSGSLRRHGFIRNFCPYVDSSESARSSHNSVLDTAFVTGGIHQCPWLGQQTSTKSSIDGLPRPQSPSIRSIHHPTPLETITEQKSYASLRARESFSIKSKASLQALLTALQPAKQIIVTKHKASFSLDDLRILRHDVHLFQASKPRSDESSIDTAPTDPTQPIFPPLPPPERIDTPPGLPTFNTAAATQYRLPPPTLRFRDIFRLNITKEEDEWEAQTSGLPHGVLMRGEDGTLVRGRFRPTQSGHTGTPTLRPFVGGPAACSLRAAPMAMIGTQRRVMFSGSTVGGLDDNTSDQLVVHDTENIAPLAGGVSGVRNMPKAEKPSNWMVFLEGLSFCFCGADKVEEELQSPRVVSLNHRVAKPHEPTAPLLTT